MRFSFFVLLCSGIELLTFLYPIAAAQAQPGTIHGKIYDSKTREPLSFASVYINRTTLGTSAAEDGSFILKNLEPGNIEMVASFVGYQTSTLTVTLRAGEVKEIAIMLVPLETLLHTVTITAEKDEQWKKNFSRFRKIFLGTDEVASRCVIVNPEVLTFTETKGNVLWAWAASPLEIRNPSLGYTLIYELVTFSSSPKHYLIRGNIQFKPMESPDPALPKKWTALRAEVYRNSIQHLFKSMIANRLQENGFRMFIEKEYHEHLTRSDMFESAKALLDPFTPADFIRPSNDGLLHVLNVRPRMELHDTRSRGGNTYRDVSYPVTWLEATSPLIISSGGFVLNPEALQLMGAMSDFRVAHSLPEDYTPERAEQDSWTEKVDH